MEFLLALSALLSALTGAFTGPRAGDTHAEAQLVAIAQAAIPARAPAIRPEQGLPSIVRLSSYVPAAASAFTPSAPLAFVRLIE